jgi:Pyruvate phosphate dikinase, AMP/ATP-binding domain
MFVIDRAAKEGAGDRVYYVTSKRYSFHGEFANANYLTLERGREFFRRNYLEANRRFILGTVAWQTKVGKFTFEFWEGDLATAEIVRETYRTLSKSFFAPLCYKPNSARQEEVSEQIAGDVPRLQPSEINTPGDYQALNAATAVGVLRIVDRMTDETIIDRNEIVIFREPPISLTPLQGVITTTFSTPLAHANLLAKGWGAPNAAKRGLGIRVVEGRRAPEQLIFNPRTGAVRVLTRSVDDTMLTFDERGGVREIKILTERRVLTDAVVRRLAHAALQIESAFGGRDQDIEWITIGNQIYIVQSRPYVEK